MFPQACPDDAKEKAEARRSAAACSSFQMVRRNPGHWDIYSKDSRHFCIRGEADRFTVWNERDPKRDLPSVFRTVDACMAYVCAELMTETSVESTSAESKS